MPENENKLASAKVQVVAYLNNNKLREAAGLIQTICEQYSDDTEAWEIYAVVNNQLGKLEMVATACHHLARLQPGSAKACFNLALALDLAGNREDSISAYQKALRIDPEIADAWYNLGRAMQEKGEPGVAISHYREALRIHPHWPEARHNMALALRAMGNLEAGICTLTEAVATNPARIKLHHTLAQFLEEDGQYEQSLQVCQKALDLEPGNARTLAHIGRALHNQGLIDKALDYYQQALHADSDDPDILLGLIDVYGSVGDYDSACKHLLPLAALHPENPGVALKYAALCKHTGKCEEAIRLLDELLDPGTLQVNIAGKIHFSLGGLLDSAGRYDLAFKHIREANRLKHYTFDVGRFSRIIDRVISIFSREAFPDMTRCPGITGKPDPVFIVGMPRSGTSLVEQIIATNKYVFAAGEQEYIPRLVAGLSDKADIEDQYPDCIRNITEDDLIAYSNQFLASIVDIDAGACKIISDKMPENFLHLGFIELLFPGSRVIHCVRDPMDTCLSCYFREFSGSHHYAYDLTSLGSYYSVYRKLMAHWIQVLSVPVHEVRYEDMVGDTESTCRNIFDFLDIEWDEKCLQYYKSGRFVNTESQLQVTQPIYTKSVGRWKHYRDHIGPLLTALDIEV